MPRSNSRTNSRNSTGGDSTRRDSSGKFVNTITKSPSQRISDGERVPKYIKNTSKEWTDKDIKQLKELNKINTPTRVIGLKLGRSESSVRGKARSLGISLKPSNRSPHTRRSR